MELTIKQKFQAFSNCLGHPIVDPYGCIDGNTSMLQYHRILADIENEDRIDFDYKALLRPLSEITEAEMINFCVLNLPAILGEDIIVEKGASTSSVKYKDKDGLVNWAFDMRGFYSGCSDERFNTRNFSFSFIDYCRQIGVDAPFFGKTLKEWGIAIYQSDLDTKSSKDF